MTLGLPKLSTAYATAAEPVQTHHHGCVVPVDPDLLVEMHNVDIVHVVNRLTALKLQRQVSHQAVEDDVTPGHTARKRKLAPATPRAAPGRTVPGVELYRSSAEYQW